MPHPGVRAGAAAGAGAAALGELRPDELTAAGWGWLACLAVVSTVVSLSLFFAGLARVGPTSASILATCAPIASAADEVLERVRRRAQAA